MDLRSPAPVVRLVGSDAIIGTAPARTVRPRRGVPLGATTGLHAIRLAAGHKPDLVIADLRLADSGSGMGAVCAIRSFNRDAPVFPTSDPTSDPAPRDGQPETPSASVIPKPAGPHAQEDATRRRRAAGEPPEARGCRGGEGPAARRRPTGRAARDVAKAPVVRTSGGAGP